MLKGEAKETAVATTVKKGDIIEIRSSSLISSFRKSPLKREIEEEENNLRNTPSKKSKPSTSKKPRTPQKYAPPEQYQHLPFLPDIITPNLIVLFVGLNPGLKTAKEGHAYAHPTNRFWPFLFSSGITSRLLHFSEDQSLPEDWQCGNTNIVGRPSQNGANLSKEEMDEGVPVLEEKIRNCRPEAVCIVGKGIWESIFRVKKGKNLRKTDGFGYGWQEGWRMGAVEGSEAGSWEGVPVFVAHTTSGLSTSPSVAEKKVKWKELGDWVNERRVARGEK